MNLFKIFSAYTLCRSEDVVKAMEACRGKMFLGLEMDISLYEGEC